VKFTHKDERDLSLIITLHCSQIHVEEREDTDCICTFDKKYEQVLLHQESQDKYEFAMKFSLRKSCSSAYTDIGNQLIKFGWKKERGSVTKYNF
jgi:hypothetical protein